MALDGGGGPTGGAFDDNAASTTVRESLTTRNGTWINWERLISVALGFVSTVWFSNLAEFVEAIFGTFLIDPLNAIGGLLSDIVRAVYGSPSLPLRASFRPAVEFVDGLGLLAFPAGVALVAIMAYVAAKGLNRDG